MAQPVTKLAVAAVKHRADTAVIGNSVIDHVSDCDRDKRTVAQMIADASNRQVVDLSFGGQSLQESINLAASALRTPGTRTIMVFISTTNVSDRDTLDIQTASFFNLATDVPLEINSLPGRFSRGVYVHSGVSDRFWGFTYQGRNYPDYNEIKSKFFMSEREHSRCPDAAARDAQYAEAFHWQNLVRPELWEPNLRDLARLQRAASERNKTLKVVLMPINYPDLSTMQKGILEAVEARRRRLLEFAHAQGLVITDASQAVGAGGFTDRYCACGHLNEQGRLKLVSVIAPRAV